MRSLRTQDTEAVTPAPAGLQVPAAVVWGTADRFQKLNPYGRRLAPDLDAPLDEIDGGKHVTPEDHPDRIARRSAASWRAPRTPAAAGSLGAATASRGVRKYRAECG